jgi:CheY-like chemotaxis protein
VATILVADDNSNIQKMVSLVFEEKGVRVVAVGNGEAACRKIPEVHPDLVLADVFMPVRNGYEVCEFVKHDPQFAEIPVVLLVGAFDPLDEKEAQRVGANGVLKKPFVPPEPLIAMVSSFLGNLEPPVVEAPAAQPKMESPSMEAPPPPPPPPARVSRGPVEEYPEPEEFTVGMSPRDFDEAESAAPTFGSPVATPSPKHHEEEPADDEEPENEWKRRRATVDYDIPEADSDDLVKRLAGEAREHDSDSADTVAVPRAHVRVPFGGAIIPEAEPELENKPTQSSTSGWMNSMTPITASPAETTSAPPASESPAIEETAPRTAVESDVVEPATIETHDETAGPQLGWADSEPRPIEASPESSEHEETEEHPQLADQSDDASSAPPAEVIPFRAPLDRMPTTEFESPSTNAPADGFQAPAPLMEEIAEIVQSKEGVEAAEGIPASFSTEQPTSGIPSDRQDEVHRYVGTFEEDSETAASPQSAAKPPVDSATIDDVVAKVLEKLEPQIHQMLSEGVLRPLVEDMLNRDSEKK